MNKVKKIFVSVLIVAVVSLGLTGCKGKSEPPAGEAPTEEHPTEETQSSEHPTKETQTEETPTGEHPK